MCRLSFLNRSGTVGRRGLGSLRPEDGKPGCSSKSEEGGYCLVQVKYSYTTEVVCDKQDMYGFVSTGIISNCLNVLSV